MSLVPASSIVAGWENPDLFPKSHPVSLSEAWVELLTRYQFEWFVTFTFRDPVGPEKADRSFRKWVHQLNKYLYGKRYYEKRDQEIYWVRAMEYQKRGVIHFHALMADTNPLSEKITFNTDKSDKSGLLYWCELWFEHSGICRIEKIRIAEFANRYVSKYVIKDGEIDVSENLTSYVPPQLGQLL